MIEGTTESEMSSVGGSFRKGPTVDFEGPVEGTGTGVMGGKRRETKLKINRELFYGI